MMDRVDDMVYYLPGFGIIYFTYKVQINNLLLSLRLIC